FGAGAAGLAADALGLAADGAAVGAFLATTFLVVGAFAATLGFLAVASFGAAAWAPAEVTFFFTAGFTGAFLVTIFFWSSAIVTHSPRWLQIHIPSSGGTNMETAKTSWAR
ncbi:MAG: hypothetical protein WCA32_12655, partial [Chromatiaceae bacterium]